MSARCFRCGGPFHPATGHIFMPFPGVKIPYCGACYRMEFLPWFKKRMAPHSGAGRARKGDPEFYEEAARSIKPPKLGRFDVKPFPPVDRYTIGHGMIGFMLGMWGMPWYGAAGISIGWELLENFILKPKVPALFPVPERESFTNAALDTATWMAGWSLAQAFPPEPATMWVRR